MSYTSGQCTPRRVHRVLEHIEAPRVQEHGLMQNSDGFFFNANKAAFRPLYFAKTREDTNQG